MEAKVYISASGQCSLRDSAEAIEVRTCFLGRGFTTDEGAELALAPDSTLHELLFDAAKSAVVLRPVAGGDGRVLHVSNIERR